MEYRVLVSEQEPVGKSIFCEVSLVSENNGSLTYTGQMYFVCDVNKNITQYFKWMKAEKEFREQIIKLGYKL